MHNEVREKACMSWHMCRGQMTTLWLWFSSHLYVASGDKTYVARLHSRGLHPLSYTYIGSLFVFYFLQIISIVNYSGPFLSSMIHLFLYILSQREGICVTNTLCHSITCLLVISTFYFRLVILFSLNVFVFCLKKYFSI